MAISFFISIDKNIVQIHNDKIIELHGKNLINVFLEACRCIHQSKKYHLVLKVAKPSLESRFLFFSFANSHPIVCTGKIKLDELLSPI